MKILHVIQSLRASGGGPPYQVAELVSRLRADGVQSTVLTWSPNDDGKYVRQVKESGSRLVELDAINARHPVSPQLIKTLPALAREADLVHLWGYWGFHGLVYRYFGMNCGTPFAISALGSLPIFLNSRIKKRVFSALIGKSLLNRTDLAFAITEDERRRYLAEGVREEKIRVIPLAVPETFFESVAPRPKEHSEKIKLLFLGRLHEKKGLQFMLPLLSELRREIPNFQLDVVGPDDGYQPQLERMVSRLSLGDIVKFHGPAYGEAKISYFRNADVFVLPSMLEQIGHAILEGAAAGLPCIYTRGCEIPELAAAGGGFETDGSPGELLTALRALLANADLRGRMGAQARRFISNGYLWPQVVASYLFAYQMIARERSREATA